VGLGSGPTRDDFRTTHVGLPNQNASCKPSASVTPRGSTKPASENEARNAILPDAENDGVSGQTTSAIGREKLTSSADGCGRLTFLC
jgi:hypothetical protein